MSLVMLNRDPKEDGHVLPYYPEKPVRCFQIKFYYVNGIKTDPPAHRKVAELVAEATESVVTGIYNLTEGYFWDLIQCVGDWKSIVKSQIGEDGFFKDRLSQSAINAIGNVSMTGRQYQPFLHALRDAFVAPDEILPSNKNVEKVRSSLTRNKASLSLFDELTKDLDLPQIVVAHSQGNLITSFTLWAIQALYGSRGLKNIQIRSISSPSPTWPRGINHQIKVYGQRDDPVTWLDPKNWTGNRSQGYWDNFLPKDPAKYAKSGGIAAHDVEMNIRTTSLYKRLQMDAGLVAK